MCVCVACCAQGRRRTTGPYLMSASSHCLAATSRAYSTKKPDCSFAHGLHRSLAYDPLLSTLFPLLGARFVILSPQTRVRSTKYIRSSARSLWASLPRLFSFLSSPRDQGSCQIREEVPGQYYRRKRFHMLAFRLSAIPQGPLSVRGGDTVDRLVALARPFSTWDEDTRRKTVICCLDGGIGWGM